MLDRDVLLQKRPQKPGNTRIVAGSLNFSPLSYVFLKCYRPLAQTRIRGHGYGLTPEPTVAERKFGIRQDCCVRGQLITAG